MFRENLATKWIDFALPSNGAEARALKAKLKAADTREEGSDHAAPLFL